MRYGMDRIFRHKARRKQGDGAWCTVDEAKARGCGLLALEIKWVFQKVFGGSRRDGKKGIR